MAIGTNNAEALQATLVDPEIIALSGNDTALGSTGDDNINGNQGDDLIFGSTGNDSLRGGQGNDQIFGEDGEDTVWGDKGNDNLSGGNGNDQIFGGEGNDQVFGNAGADFINGNQGNDTLRGGEDNDTVRGGQGNDSIFGDKGNDSLYGDKGADTLVGGAGSDCFVIGNGTGGPNLADADLISDYTDGTDRIALLDGLTFADLTIANGTGAFATDTTIRVTATGEWLARIAGVNAASITASDFKGDTPAPPAPTPPPPPAPSPVAPPPPPPAAQNIGGPPPDLAVIPAVPPPAPPAPPPPPPPPVASIAAGTTPTEAGPTNGTFTVTLDTAPTADVAIGYSFNGSTATGGGVDYSDPGDGSITIAAGQTTGTITTNIVDDSLVDPDETIIATLSPGSGYTVGSTNTATLTIADNDPSTISIVQGVTPQEDDPTTTASDPVNGTFVLTRVGSPAQISQALTVNYTIGGTATAGTDFNDLGNESVTFNPGDAEAIIQIRPINDSDTDPGETVTATITAPTGYSIDGAAAQTLTILDDDVPSVSINAAPGNAREWDATLAPPAPVNGTFNLIRTGANTSALTVPISIGGTASTTDGTDYTITDGNGNNLAGATEITIPANVSSVPITVTPVRDADITETGNETVDITIQAATATPVNYFVQGSPTASLTIEDEALTVAIAAGTTTPTEAGSTAGTFTLTRTGSPTNELRGVAYTVGGTATNGTDYAALLGTVDFAAGSATATITVTPTGDDGFVDPNETVDITLDSPPVAGFTALAGSNNASLTILDAQPFVQVNITAGAGATEANTAAGSGGTFTLTRAGDTTNAVNVTYDITGTATEGAANDYTLNSLAANPAGTTVTNTGATIPAGASSITIEVIPVDDGVGEGAENVTLNVTDNAQTYAIGISSATIQIADNDGTPGPDVLTGTGILAGGDGDDNITATAAGATLIGGLGNDTLTGGAGNDQFRFNATNEGQDTINNFNAAGTDTIQVASGSFGGLAPTSNPAPTTQFISGAGTVAANGAGAPQFIYDTTSGQLRYDADGVAGGEILLATLAGAPALGNANIVYV
ncbi:MAG: hypothetical protein F6J93_00935 [Oscillatoria sp. SIO1A7]|nr:hypothetical protein [Oscillatoria sp. SIO1A7]